MLGKGEEPEIYQEAKLHDKKHKQFKAMQGGMISLHENYDYILVKLPKDKKAFKYKRVYMQKIISKEKLEAYRQNTGLVEPPKWC